MFAPDEDLVKSVNQLQKEMHDEAMKGQTCTIVDFDLLSQMIQCVFATLGIRQQIEINRHRTFEEVATVVLAMGGNKTKEFAKEVAAKIGQMK